MGIENLNHNEKMILSIARKHRLIGTLSFLICMLSLFSLSFLPFAALTWWGKSILIGIIGGSFAVMCISSRDAQWINIINKITNEKN